MLENGRAVASEVLVEGYAVADATKEISESVLPVLERPLAKLEAVELDQVEGAQHRGMVVMPIAEEIGPSGLTTIASPSTTHDRTGKPATAAAIFRKRAVKS